MVVHALFFVRHFPSAWHFEDTEYFTGHIDESVRAELHQRLGDFGPERDFFAGPADLSGLAFRSEGADERQALAHAREKAEAFVDALALMAYERAPEISNLVLLGAPGATDARVLLFSPEVFFEFGSTPPPNGPARDERAEKVSSMIVPLLDLAAGSHPRSGSPLGEQLAYALKMFRHGSAAGAYAIEFICKFTAMESLVCGGQRDTKRANLVARLGRLFPGDTKLTPDYLNKLWDVRNLSVHEARGFHREMATNPVHVQGHLANLDRIVLAVVTYAVAHLEVADSVQALWDLPAGYRLPHFTATFRPQVPGRFRVEGKRVTMNLGIVLSNGHTIFRKFLPTEPA